MGEIAEFHVSQSDLEGEKCPPHLRPFVTIWVAWKAGDKSGKTNEEFNNRAGRLRVSGAFDAITLEARKLPVEFHITGARLKPEDIDSEATQDFCRKNNIPD